jgi:hypothetical protein
MGLFLFLVYVAAAIHILRGASALRDHFAPNSSNHRINKASRAKYACSALRPERKDKPGLTKNAYFARRDQFSRILLSLASLLAPSLCGSTEAAVTTGSVVICATAADAKNYAALHKHDIKSAIERETSANACLVAKIAFLPGKRMDFVEDKAATYAVTEILIVAVSTADGLLKIGPNLAYTLLRLHEEQF